MFALFNAFLMIVVVVDGKPFVAEKNNFVCGQAPSIEKYIDYNNIHFDNNDIAHSINFFPLLQNNNKLVNIIHGHSSIESDWPWIVTLNYGPNYFFTGSIVSPNFVLTARHCFVVDNVGYGSVNETLQKRVNIVKKFYFNNTDFGLLQVEKPFEFDGENVAPICLSAKFDSDPNEILAAAGYGLVFRKTVKINATWIFPVYNDTKILQETAVEHRADPWCKHPLFHPETMLCIGGAASGVARGDSGSPIMAIRNNKWYALGVLSAGFFENVPSDDLVQITHAWYTKVKPYCNWLSEVTHGEVMCEE